MSHRFYQRDSPQALLSGYALSLDELRKWASKSFSLKNPEKAIVIRIVAAYDTWATKEENDPNSSRFKNALFIKCES